MCAALSRPENALCVASTGSGKTLMMIDLARRASARTVIVVGRDKLVEQTARRARELLPDVGVWSAGQGEKRVGAVTVVSIHSADELTIPDLRLAILDECHNVSEGRYTRFLARHPGVRIAGFTATPWRGGMEIFAPGQLFERVHYSISLRELIRDGHLVRPVARAMPESFDVSGLRSTDGDYVQAELGKLAADRSKVSAQVADAIPRLAGCSKIVWTCVSIEHAESVADRIAGLGESVACIHSKSPDPAYAMECFERGPIRHAVSVMMLSEGIDIPAVDAVVLMRPTQSPTLAVQTIGRGLRPFPGKSEAVILDYGHVIENCGPVDAPNVRPYGERRKSADKYVPVVRVCSECCAYVPADIPVCPECGHEEKRVVDRLAALERQAAQVAIMSNGEPETFECVSVSADLYKSKKGNDCVRIRFNLRGRTFPAFYYISDHPVSWDKASIIVRSVFVGRFPSWAELASRVDQTVLCPPKTVTIKKVNGFDNVVGINS